MKTLNLLVLVRGFLFAALLGTAPAALADTYKAWINISVDASENIAFHFRARGESEVPMNSFSIIEERNGSWDYTAPAWSGERRSGSYQTVKEIVYGIPVSGLNWSQARELVIGRHYMAEMSGAGMAVAVEFVIKISNGKKIIQSLGMAGGQPKF